MSKTTIRNLIIALILITVAAAAFGLMIYKITEQSSQLAVQVNTLATQRAQETSYFKLLRLFEDTKTDRKKLKEYFLVKESDSIDFLTTVESLATQEGVSLKTTSLESITDKESGAEWIKISFAFKGSRSAVQHFIKILEFTPYVSKVSGVSMKSLSSIEWQAEVVMQVQILTYDK